MEERAPMSQAELDNVFALGAEDRAALMRGIVPRVVRREHGWVSGRPTRGVAETIWLWILLFVLGAALSLSLDTALSSPRLGNRRHAVMAGALAVAIAASWRAGQWISYWRRRRQVLSSRPELRVVEGVARTSRRWVYGYGDCYHLESTLHIGGEALWLNSRVGSRVLEGRLSVVLLTIPSARRLYRPFCEQIAAIELLEGATFLEKTPGRPAPSEPPSGAECPAD